MLWWILGSRLQPGPALQQELLRERRSLQVIYGFCLSINAIHLTTDALDFFNRHIGDSNAECLCPYGYRGNKCETHEFLDEDNGEFGKKAAFAQIMQQNETFLLAFRM